MTHEYENPNILSETSELISMVLSVKLRIQNRPEICIFFFNDRRSEREIEIISFYPHQEK